MNSLKRINSLHAEINGQFHEAALKMGMSDSVLGILYTICDLGDRCPLTELVWVSGISKQTINSALRKMEGEGLLYLEGNRRKTICLTDAGRQLLSGTVERLRQKENAIFESWTEAEREQYFALTRRYVSQLREKVRELDA